MNIYNQLKIDSITNEKKQILPTYPFIIGFQYPFNNLMNFNIIHNQNTINFDLQCYINNILSFVNFKIIDPNTIEINLSEPETGIINIMFFINS